MNKTLIAFGVPRTLDGSVRVYGPKFIQFRWQGALARARDLPFNGSEVVKSVEDAKKFIKELGGK